ncbi:MAG TPA: serine hydrolase [Gemmatimonadaceae bacterium]|nr:serine hydrolase [Gemmatimonadaceae bacterium]
MRAFPLLLLSVPVLIEAQSDPRLRELDAYAARTVREWRAPGLAFAVVKDGRVVFAKGYGVRELGGAAPVDTQTLFAIGSTTKAMTAMALAMLVDEGKVKWDDPVAKYLPDFQLNDPYVTREVTVRDLLTHRAGLPNADFLWYGTDLSIDEIVRRMRMVRPAYSLRSSFIYQNVMYAVAGRVVAAASGMPWAQFLRTRIFTPLGMTRTVTSLAEASRSTNVAAPHFIVDDTVRVISNAAVDAVAPAGAIWSSIADMAKWTRFILDSGRVDGHALVKASTFAELVKPQAMVPASEFYPTARLTHPHWQTYGFGWFQQDYDGRKLDFHTGSIDGMVAIVGVLLDERVGVYVLSNLDHNEARHALMLKTLDTFTSAPERDWSAELQKLYGGLRVQAAAAQTAAEQRRIAGTHPSLPLARYAGSYADSLYGSVTITEDNGLLRLRSGRLDATLEHWQYDTFRARWDHRWQGTSMVTFTIGLDGKPSVIDVDGTSFARVQDATNAAQE